MFKVNNKDTGTMSMMSVSLLLSLNIFQPFFYYFCCWFEQINVCMDAMACGVDFVAASTKFAETINIAFARLFPATFCCHQKRKDIKEIDKYGVISSPYFPVFGPEITPYLDTFHAVTILKT